MPLINDTGFIADSWVHVSDEDALPQADSIIVPFARLEEALSANIKNLGVHISNTALPASLTPHFNKLALISIGFPTYADGRGFSIARSIRNADFAGELRAFGLLIADQYAYALSCGFNTIEIPEELAIRQPEAQWKEAHKSLSLSYQRSYVHGKNILDQRRVNNKPSLLPLREKVSRSDG
jgi:uncharacterized protein (DUF934 family)